MFSHVAPAHRDFAANVTAAKGLFDSPGFGLRSVGGDWAESGTGKEQGIASRSL
jgi:hypothetical protein